MQGHESSTMSEAEKYHARRQVNMHVAEYLLFTVTVSQPHALATSLYIVKLPSFVNSSRVQIKKDDVNLPHSDPTTC